MSRSRSGGSDELLAFPGLRLRDTVRVVGIIVQDCHRCGLAGDVDVIALACRYGAAEPVQDAVRRQTCAGCGTEGCGYRAVEAPPAPLYARRLEELIEPACRLTAECGACHRRRELDSLLLARAHKLGPDTTLLDVQKRLRCQGCGQRGWTRLRLFA